MSEAISDLILRTEPEAQVLLAEAYLNLDDLDRARSCCETVLGQRSADSIPGLIPLLCDLCRRYSRSIGWIAIDSNLHLIGEVNCHGSIELTGKDFRSSFDVTSDGGLWNSFRVQMPTGLPAKFHANTGWGALIGADLAWPPPFRFSGWVIEEESRLEGCAQIAWEPSRTLQVIARTSSGYEVRVTTNPPQESIPANFLIPMHSLGLEAGSFIDVLAELPDGTEVPLCCSPISINRRQSYPIDPFISARAELRAGAEPTSSRLDIVVPVYGNREESLSCLEHVLATCPAELANLVVVNDASTDDALQLRLVQMAEKKRIELLVNESNLGFPGSVNRGMNLHGDRDVIILNSDAFVFNDWVERLRTAAYSARDIGTVTALSDNSSITTYTATQKGTLDLTTAAEIDFIARRVNAGVIVDLPVGVGFCLYIKRACLDEIGVFDEWTFGKGYGEENDFCLRARRNGWRHVAAANVFIHHAGGRSFGSLKQPLVERNSRILNMLHPGYDRFIADFLAADPLARARRALDMQRLRNASGTRVLLVTLDLPGGVDRAVRERVESLRETGRSALIMRGAGSENDVRTIRLNSDEPYCENLSFDAELELGGITDFLLSLRLDRIEFHSFVGLPPGALDVVTVLGVPYDVYVHDYSWVCPRLTLLGGEGKYCGEPAIDECERCLRVFGGSLEPDLTVSRLRDRSRAFLKAAQTVTAPTFDTQARLRVYFPEVPSVVVPLEEQISIPITRRLQVRDRIHVAIIGAISSQKGYRVVLDCARDAAKRDLNLDFVVIGYTLDDQALIETGRVFVTGPYKEYEVNDLLEREGCHVAFFASVTPETWCYTLSHAIRKAMPVLSFDLGAIAERLQRYPFASLLPLASSTSEINDSLLALAAQWCKPETSKELAMNETSSDTPSTPIPALESSVDVIQLPAGIYAFSVEEGGGTYSDDGLAVPALHVALAPIKSAGSIEFVPGGCSIEGWLSRAGDIILVRISTAPVSLLLTSVHSPSSEGLTVNIKRLDAQPVADPAEAEDDARNGIVRPQILAHIKNFGDVLFNAGRASFPGAGLWIEAFFVKAPPAFPHDSVEYRATTIDGFQTPWLSNQILCGARGRGAALAGFAVRLKPALAASYDVFYKGAFISGATEGPNKNGEVCCSKVQGDALEGIELFFAPKEPQDTSAAPLSTPEPVLARR